MTDSPWTESAQRARDRRWAFALGALCLVGASDFLAMPREMLRGHWDTSVAWMIVLGCCAAAAAAIWSGRQYARAAVVAMAWGMLALWALVLTAARPFSIPGVSLPVLVVMTLALLPLHFHVSEPL
jgi:hypothetical protein